MGASGGFPIDIVLFGMIAAFLVLRLRSVLGRRQGFEHPPESAQSQTAQPEPAAAPPVTADPASPTGSALVRMQLADPSFQPARFLEGAHAAFRLIVEAFAAGNRDRLHPLLSDDTYHAFEAAIAARETAGETQRTEIRAIPSATIEQADLRASTANITVRFVSDQINVTLGSDGQPAAGADAVTEITDLWTFERSLGSTDPTWRLIAARSA